MNDKIMFAPDGCEVTVITKLADSSFIGTPIVHTVDEYGDEYEVEGALTRYPALFEKMPTAKEHPQVKERERELETLDEKILIAQEKLAGLNDGVNQLKKIPCADHLRLLIDISSGVSVWMIKDQYYPEIHRYPDDFRKSTGYDRDNSEIPAISFRSVFDHTQGRWSPMKLVLHQYHDGSGSSYYDKVAFFRDEESAREHLKKLLIESAKKTPFGHSGSVYSMEERLKKHGIEYPSEFAKVLADTRAAELAQTEKQLAEIQAKADSLRTATGQLAGGNI